MEYGKVVLVWFANMPLIIVGDPEIVKVKFIMTLLKKSVTKFQG